MEDTNKQQQFIGTVALQEAFEASLHLLVKGSMYRKEFSAQRGQSKQNFFSVIWQRFLTNQISRHQPPRNFRDGASKLAVQVARLLGAKRVVGTGRNAEQLAEIRELGADAVIDLKQSDDGVVEAFKQEAGASGYHVILDFLWGHPTELLLEALVPHELSFAKHRVRLVQIGEMAGPTISLHAQALRTSGLELLGAGSGITPEAVAEGTQQVWEWIKAGHLRADVEQVPLRDVESAWRRTDVQGKRIVIVP